jgi:hypothetical protein
MRKSDVYNVKQAFAYMTDCTLATVIHMAQKRTRVKREYELQVRIAQSAIDWMQSMELHHYYTRAKDVIDNCNGDVKKWADQFDVRIPKPRPEVFR